ncbi:MAG TPA: hypothetical protein ENH48_04570 [Halieaceae bacterium]|nr:hypothetical protein [Halieaceae bacterium]
MLVIKKLAIALTLLCVIASNSVSAADTSQKLFVNLTSDEINRATMAIAISTKVLTELEIPATIYLSVEGVRIVDKNIPQQKHANGKSLKEMLSAFMKKGGRVIVCGMCLENIGGIKKDEVIEGVDFVGALSALFEDGTTVLSY